MVKRVMLQNPVFRTIDKAVQQINLYPADKCLQNVLHYPQDRNLTTG